MNDINKYLIYEQAKQIILPLKIKSAKEWFEYTKNNKLDRIPIAPNLVYKNKGWISWGEWLGTHNISSKKRQFLPYQEAKIFAISLKIKSVKEWNKYLQNNTIPSNIPSNPYYTYKNCGWIDWQNWLGIEHILEYDEAEKFVQSLKLEFFYEWKKYHTKHNIINIPIHPNVSYKNKGWVSWGKFLGTNKRQRIKITPMLYEEAQKIMQDNNIETNKDFREFCKNSLRPNNFPTHPDRTYKNNGWIDWCVFLGKRQKFNYDAYLSYKEAKNYLKQYEFCCVKEWFQFVKSNEFPLFLPKSPEIFYKQKDWIDWDDFLSSTHKMSYGETLVFKYLSKLDLDFKFQYRFNITGMRRKPYDFGININNQTFIIEFYGQQHYKPVYWGNKNNLEKRQQIDKLKQEYCKNNNIPLLIISYKEIDNIKILIDNFIRLAVVKP